MGFINWFKDIFKPKDTKDPYTPTPEPESRVPAPFDWDRKIVILSVAPNSYKEWITIEDLYQAFKERLDASIC
jgi:hypothetical protein